MSEEKKFTAADRKTAKGAIEMMQGTGQSLPTFAQVIGHNHVQAIGDYEQTIMRLKHNYQTLLRDYNHTIMRLRVISQAPATWRAPAIEPVEIADHKIKILDYIRRALANGELSSADLLSLIDDSQSSRRGPKQPPVEIQIKLVERFEQMRRDNGITQELFVAHFAGEICPCSLASFKRYYKNVKRYQNLS